jgi:predicted lipoprotein with Yx(FWY)xxD motif
MTSRGRFGPALAVSVAALAVALGAAGCGSDDEGGGGGLYGGGGATTTAGTSGAPAGTVVVSVADNPELGRILVDSSGMTVYLFEKDKDGNSSCYGACASVWPPLSGQPKGADGARAARLGTTQRADGTTQVTYNRFPLYTYVGDARPGDANGNDFEQFGAEWYAVTPAGGKPED